VREREGERERDREREGERVHACKFVYNSSFSHEVYFILRVYGCACVCVCMCAYLCTPYCFDLVYCS